MNFQPDEAVLFKHRSSLQGTGQTGDLIVTSLRLCFAPNDNGQVQQRSWNSIGGIKYAPANDPKNRVMMKIDGVEAGSSSIYHLIGPNVTENKAELERLKGIISNIRKVDKPAQAQQQQSRPSSNGASQASSQQRRDYRNQTQKTIDKLSNSGSSAKEQSGAMSLTTEMKNSLLNADKSLAKQYKQLVLEDKILDDNEFWTTHTNVNTLAMVSGGDFRQKGKATTLFADIKKTYRDGKLYLDVQREHKEHIFAMYPAVKKAFEHEVPLNMSEQEFWVAYFQSEYYSRDKGLGDVYSEVRTDDIFSRYDTKLSTSSIGAAGSSAARQPTTKGDRHKSENLTGLVDPTIDLTANANDFHKKEDSVVSEGLVGKGSAGAASAPLGAAGSRSMVTEKYNRHSALYMQGTVGARESRHPGPMNGIGKTSNVERKLHPAGGDKDVDDDDDDKSPYELIKEKYETSLSEQLKEREPNYVPLNVSMKAGQQGHEAVVSEDTNGRDGGMIVRTQSIDTSGDSFVRDRTALAMSPAKSGGGNGLKRPIGSVAAASPESVFVKREKLDPALLKSSNGIHTGSAACSAVGLPAIQSVFPNPKTSVKHIQDLIKAFPQLPKGEALSKDQHLQSFQQEMLEAYTGVVELARHFYALLGRLGLSQSGVEQATDKVAKLLKRFDSHEAQLRARRTAFASAASSADGTAAATIVSDILMIIGRVRMKWDSYQKSLG